MIVDDEARCERCGRLAEGFAMIGDKRYCHPDYGRSCYYIEPGILRTWTEPNLGRRMLAEILERIEQNPLDLGGLSSAEYVRKLRDQW